MTTLIIEQNKEPQDVPGVVIPPPGVSEPVIKNTPFFLMLTRSACVTKCV